VILEGQTGTVMTNERCITESPRLGFEAVSPHLRERFVSVYPFPNLLIRDSSVLGLPIIFVVLQYSNETKLLVLHLERRF
jgi:hypothetical protein